MLTHAMEHSRVGAAARGRLLGLRRQDRPTLRTCNTLAFRRCWPTATSCISSRRNILTEHIGWHQNNLCRRTFLTRTAASRCFIQASYSSGLSTHIIQVLGLMLAATLQILLQSSMLPKDGNSCSKPVSINIVENPSPRTTCDVLSDRGNGFGLPKQVSSFTAWSGTYRKSARITK